MRLVQYFSASKPNKAGKTGPATTTDSQTCSKKNAPKRQHHFHHFLRWQSHLPTTMMLVCTRSRVRLEIRSQYFRSVQKTLHCVCTACQRVPWAPTSGSHWIWVLQPHLEAAIALLFRCFGSGGSKDKGPPGLCFLACGCHLRNNVNNCAATLHWTAS